jgi:hypothetical protein
MFRSRQQSARVSAPAQRRGLYRLWYFGLAAFLGLIVVGAANPPSAPPAQPPAVPQPMGPAAPVNPASPMDEPLRLLAEAKKAYAGVKDYSCLLLKRERMDGPLQPLNVMVMKVRAEPFSVYLRWQEPRDKAGQEACYVAGKNNGQMRVRSSGVLGAVGFVSMDPNDPKAQKNSRHSITEAGFGNLLERYAARWEKEREINRTKVSVAEYEYAKRRCIRVETVHPREAADQFAFSRNVLYFDKETHLPVRVECYDWPRPEGGAGDLVEEYSYVNVRLNVGLGDDVFNH